MIVQVSNACFLIQQRLNKKMVGRQLLNNGFCFLICKKLRRKNYRAAKIGTIVIKDIINNKKVRPQIQVYEVKGMQLTKGSE